MRSYLSDEELRKYIAAVRPLKEGFDLVTDHVVITDPNANIIYANKAVERNTGFSREEAVGKNPGDLWGGEMPREFYEKMWQTIKTEKKPFVGEVKNKRKDGVEYWQEIHITPVLDEGGEVRFFIGIEPNITERKEKEQFRDEFVSIMAHQLKTPLASFKWTLEWLVNHGGLQGDQQEMVSQMYKGNQSLINLVADLLVVARAGNIGEKREPFDLITEIEAVIADTKLKNPRVLFSFANDGAALLSANKSLVMQVFINLIANAAEYSDKAQGSVQVLLKKAANGHLFSVANNGPHIPKQDQAKIFGKFFRASNANEMKKTGSGLGLYIVKMVADSMGWKVWFESPGKEGEGAVFFVEIPK